MAKFTDAQIEALRNDFAKLDGIDPCEPSYSKLVATLDAMPDDMLQQVATVKPRIKFMSLLAINRCTRRNISLEGN